MVKYPATVGQSDIGLVSGPKVLNRCAEYTIDITNATGAVPAIITVNPQDITPDEWNDGHWLKEHPCKVLWSHENPQTGYRGRLVETFKIPSPACKEQFDAIYVVDGSNHWSEVPYLTLKVSPCYPNTSFKLPMSNKCGRVRTFFGV